MKIAVQEVAGELASRQIEFDASNEEQAAEMFRKALTEFSMVKLTKVEIVGKPEITTVGGNARVLMNVRVSPDLEQWKVFAPSLLTILTKTATRRATFIVPTDLSNYALDRQLEGNGVLVAVLVNAVGNRTRWEVFRVPEAMEAAIKTTVSRIRCKLVCVLQDENGKEINRNIEPWRYSNGYSVEPITESPLSFAWSLRGWFIGPEWDSNHGCAVVELRRPIDVSAEDLRRVAKTAAFIEECTEK